MENSETMAVENSVTPTESEVEETVEQPVTNNEPVKTYTKEEVQALMKRRVDRSHKRVWDRYGVKSFEELDDILKDYKSIKDNYASLEARNSDLSRDIALLKNNTLPEKRDDIIAYFKGSGIEFNEDNLISALQTHPEWLKPQNLKIETLGLEKTANPEVDEKEIASRIFGTKI